MLVTLANPLPLAIVGNPPRGARMAKRHRRKTARAKLLARRRQLKYRWKMRTRPGGRYAGFKAVVHEKAGRRKKHKSPRGRRWAWTGRKGTVSLFRKGLLVATNPAGAIKRAVIDPVTSLPKTLPALFKGKGMIKHVGFAVGGALTGLVGGSVVQNTIMGFAGRFLPAMVANAMSKGIVQRVVGASFALGTGSLIARFAIKDRDTKQAFVTGVAAAALVEAIFPGRVAGLLANVPVVGGLLAPKASPVQGLAGLFGSDELAGVGAYVDASAYQGVGAYVDSPSYQGVGGSMDDAVAGYVDSPGYQGVGADPNQLAGSGHLSGLGAMGSNMLSHLDS